MRTHNSKATRHRGAPPGRRTLDARAEAEHYHAENLELRDKVAALEARVQALVNALDEMYPDIVAQRAREAGL